MILKNAEIFCMFYFMVKMVVVVNVTTQKNLTFTGESTSISVNNSWSHTLSSHLSFSK